MENYILFHKDCTDGSGAALAAYLKFGDNAKYIPVQYNTPLPEISSGSNVYILDFSYPKDILEELNNRSKSLIVLDHHKTAMEQLKGLPYAKFDMEKSGAVLAWEYFHEDSEEPYLFKIIQDRDLWKFKLPETKEVSAALQTIKNFKDFIPHLFDIEELKQKGKMKLDYDTEVIRSMMSKTVVGVWGDKTCALINATGLFSDLGNEIYTNYNVDFVAMFFVTSDGKMVFSMRSNKCDVSNIAKQYGGGGHMYAAGMCVSLMDGTSILQKMFTNAQPLENYKKK